jgi:hypothetical protein
VASHESSNMAEGEVALASRSTAVAMEATMTPSVSAYRSNTELVVVEDAVGSVSDVTAIG